MILRAGISYRAKTVLGDQIVFHVIDPGIGGWANVILDDAPAVDTNVWLNTALLLWIVSNERPNDAITKAADEVIQALESSANVYGAD